MTDPAKDRVIELRTNIIKLSQKELCAKIGMSQGYYADIERGRSQVSLNLLLKLNKVLNVSIDWIVSGKGSVFLSEEKDIKNKHQTNPDNTYEVINGTVKQLDEVNDENIQHTKWFKELSKERQWVIAAVNTPEMVDDEIMQKTHEYVNALINTKKAEREIADSLTQIPRHKKGKTG